MDTRKSVPTSIAVVGLGYVGIQLAVAFAGRSKVIGYDINKKRILRYRNGEDVTGEVGDSAIAGSGIFFTSDAGDTASASSYIVAVPTPVDKSCLPDLRPLRLACETVGTHLHQDNLVVFESTVYPGVTEDICVPVLEQFSGLRCGTDFYVGYSPERISPGDTAHTLGRVSKIVSGFNPASHARTLELYKLILDPALICPAHCIRVAEASKLVENTQRDLLIAFANEMAHLFEHIGLDAHQVFACAGTKWNFSGVHPGLVGGHCIGVDPYYLMHLAEESGRGLKLVNVGRQVNEDVVEYIAGKVDTLAPPGARQVLVYGATYKEGVPDIRNSKALELAGCLRRHGYRVSVMDDLVHPDDIPDSLDISFLPETAALADVDVVVFAVGHRRYRAMDLHAIRERCSQDALLVDLNRIVVKGDAEKAGFRFWGLW